MTLSGRFELPIRQEEEICRYERDLWNQGVIRVAGVDEVGRGPLAGPVVSAAVVLPVGVDVPGIRDSKQMTAKQRQVGYGLIYSACASTSAINIGIAAVSAKQIDRIGILNAALLSMKRAIERLDPAPDYLLIDGLFIPNGITIPALALVKGDSKSRSIAAASVVAKVIRDRLMTSLDPRYPDYHFASNKGYGSPAHIATLLERGGSPHHRYSFAPLADHQRTIPLNDRQK